MSHSLFRFVILAVMAVPSGPTADGQVSPIADVGLQHIVFAEALQENLNGGPWQDSLRDIDPSCTLVKAAGGTSWSGHATSWWCPAAYENWGTEVGAAEWLDTTDDLPDLQRLLLTDDDEGPATRWVNLQGHFNWYQPHPADYDPSDVVRRELWLMCTGYLLREVDVRLFMGRPAHYRGV